MARPWIIEQLRDAARLDLAEAEKNSSPDSPDRQNIAQLAELLDKLERLIPEAESSARAKVRELLDTRPSFIPPTKALPIIAAMLMIDAPKLLHDVILDIVAEFEEECVALEEMELRIRLSQGGNNEPIKA